MTYAKFTYYSLLLVILFGCNLSKNVPQGSYLLKKNNIEIKGEHIDKADLGDIIKQQPNRSTLGIKLRLWAYNQNRFFGMKSDSLTIGTVRHRKNLRINQKNERRLLRQEKINHRRIKRAQKIGDSTYYEKIIPIKDTVNPRRFLREWFKYKFGEKPVIVDSNAIQKSVTSMQNYMIKQGFFEADVSSKLDTNRNKRNIIVNYIIETNQPYIIDSIKSYSENKVLLSKIPIFVQRNFDFRLKGERLSSDAIQTAKDRLAKFFRNQGFYGFTSSNITVEADTTLGNHRAFVSIFLGDRTIRRGNDFVKVPQAMKKIRNVYFHLADTTKFKGNFHQKATEHNINLNLEKYLPTFDSLHFAKIKYNNKEKRRLGINSKGDTLKDSRKATFYFNRKPYTNPEIIEFQNLLESGEYYKEYLANNSVTRLMELNIFQTIKPEILEIGDTNLLDVHYYLVPYKKQSFSFEPRFTNSNGFIGAAAAVKYSNKNLFGGAENLTISLAGGLESTPPIFDGNLDGSSTKYQRTFNTFEFGPQVKLEIPGAFPVPNRFLKKSIHPITAIAVSYNRQHRPDFKREVFQLDYNYKLNIAENQILSIGLPFASVLKFIRIEKDAFFQQKLLETNDLFLRNAYSNQVIWEDVKLIYEYNNFNSYKHKRLTFYYKGTLNHVGLIPRLFAKGYNEELKQRTIFKVSYSEFIRMDNELIGQYKVNREQSFNFRFMAGAGIPYGNITTSLPYDYSFFAGGANDNRGWAARTLGPGAYKYYLDENRTITEIGDIRLGMQMEYRFSLSKLFKFACFIDANNIWSLHKDINRPGSEFTKDFLSQIALSPGVGLRLDFTYFVIRFDLGIPITNPALPDGAKWIFQSRKPYYAEGLATFGDNYKSKMPRPFTPALQFGIGYPF